MTHQTNGAHDPRIVVKARRSSRRRAVAAVAVPVVVVALAVAATPAHAQNGLGPSSCSDLSLEFFGLEFRTAGQLVSYVAQEFGNSGTHNPGNAHNPFPPFVPFDLGCNPTAPQGDL
jgi:hypothetical protein